MIQYYFSFFSGLYEFYKKRFTQTINFYRIAESHLHKIPDEIERAEFNYQVAIAYYEIRQNYFSLNHAERALESFKANGMYSNRAATCQMVIACNKIAKFSSPPIISTFRPSELKCSFNSFSLKILPPKFN